MSLRSIAFALLLCLGADAAAAEDASRIFAPTGKLRVGVYPGSPSSMVQDKATGETRGVTVEIARELAARLGAPVELVVYPRVADVIEGMKAGAVDFTVTNASPARAQEVDFGPNLLSLELGYLVAPSSRIRDVAELNAPGVRIGVTKGSTSERTLPAMLPGAAFVAAASLKEAVEMLGSGRIEAYATNKAILFELSDQLPGSRVLEGRWGTEHMAAAIPKGRPGAMDYLKAFSKDETDAGAVVKAAERAGLRGLAKN